MSDKTRYICNGPVRHNGERYATDADIELEQKYSKPLLAADAIRPITSTDVENIKPKVTDEQIKQANLVDAISQLDEGNKEHFTTDGKPQVKALEALVKFDIDAEQRDAAFEIFQANEDKKAD